MICDKCKNKWDCYEPCEDAIGYQDLPQEYRIPEGEYVASGVHLEWVRLDGTKPEPFKENKE